MPSTNFSVLLLSVFLLLATKVSSYEWEELKVNTVKRTVSPATPPPVVTSPKPPTPSPLKPPSTPPAPAPPAAPIVRSKQDCIPLCNSRCKLHSRKNICVRACLTCCDRCKCVPPGTYGNREVCGKCYTDMLTRGNRSKCP